ncbi:MAG: hypothetical protein ACRCV0_06045 [Brevinema sp.]
MTLSSKKISNIVAILIISILSLYPLVVNFKYNDHSKNWLNHDYGKNLLSSTEEYSVFMTEGGDNQVFSSLYFTYAEKLRQDLFPYDQKGNIFKKIYGDLRYVTAETLEARRPIVDRGLFTGEEPFYENIRSAAMPYLVPYALGKPSTYLTWKLPNPQNLGDFYYKNYGQMYKVQHIRYAILDYLEFMNTESVSVLKEYLSDLLGRTINNNEWNSLLADLKKNGYITEKNNNIILLKTYQKPFYKDPKDTFLKRWDDIKNLEYYDYLSREIVNSFAFEQIGLISDEVQNIKSKPASSKENQEKITKYTQEKWKEIEYYISLIEKSGYDSVAILHNLGIFYLSAQDHFNLQKDYLPEAVKTWEQVVNNFIYSWSTYDILLWSYLKLILKDSQQTDLYLEKFDHYYNQLTNATTHWKSMKANIKKSRPYQSTIRLIEFRKNIESISGANFDLSRKKALATLISATPDVNLIIKHLSDLVTRLSLDQNKSDITTLNDFWRSSWRKLRLNSQFLRWHVQMMHDIIAGIGEGIIDSNLVNMTLAEGTTIINTVSELQQKFNTAFYLLNIAKLTGNNKYENQYISLVLEIAEKNLPAEEYTRLKNQLTK